MGQNDKFFNDIVKKVEEPAQKVISQEVMKFSNLIKQYAEQFLTVYKRNNRELEEIANNYRKSINSVKGIKQGNTQMSYEYRKLTENRHLMTKTDHRREMVESSLLFQKRLNELLNQKVELVYVYEDETGNAQTSCIRR